MRVMGTTHREIRQRHASGCPSARPEKGAFQRTWQTTRSLSLPAHLARARDCAAWQPVGPCSKLAAYAYLEAMLHRQLRSRRSSAPKFAEQ